MGWSERWRQITRNPLVRCVVILVVAIGVGQLFTIRSSSSNGELKALPRNPIVLLDEQISDIVSPIMPSWLGFWKIKKPKGSFHILFPDAEEIEKEAFQILPIVQALRETRFFRIFKVDLTQECPLWAREDLCSSPLGSCAVCECTDDQIPLPWKERPIEHFVDRSFYDSAEITPWIDTESSEFVLHGTAQAEEEAFLASLSGREAGGRATYVDLSMNPPGFTAYRGRNIWSLIYNENCLRLHEEEMKNMNLTSNPITKINEEDLQCTLLEEDLFERVISGLQTTIMVLAAEYNRPLNTKLPMPFSAPTTQLKDSSSPSRHWYNMNLFRWRVSSQRRWIENLYIDFSLLLRALVSTQGVINSCECYTGTELEDQESRHTLKSLIEKAKTLKSGSTNVPIFKKHQELALKQFRNISDIFNCVECEKCRLHGKVKLAALQVAIKSTGPVPVRSLERNEITALINALGYFADAILIIKRFENRTAAFRQLTYLSCLMLLVLLASTGGYLYCWYLDLRSGQGRDGILKSNIPLAETITTTTQSSSSPEKQQASHETTVSSRANRRE